VATTNYQVPVLSSYEWQRSVIDKDLSTPPVSPSKGNRYIVGPSPSGDWTTHANHLVTCTNAVGPVWDFVVPPQGSVTYVADEELLYYYNGSIWREYVDAAFSLMYLPHRGKMFADDMTAVAGTGLTTTSATGQRYGYYSYMGSYANGDSAEWSFVCAGDTYNFYVSAAFGSAMGIVDFYIDDVLVDSGWDTYNATALFNQIRTFSVTLTPGAHKFRYVANGKNPLSSAWRFFVTWVSFKPPVD